MVLSEIKDSGLYQGFYDEATINEIGYHKLWQGQAKQAVLIHGVGTALFPESSNMHDSFSESLTAYGDVEYAKKAFKRALELKE